MPLYENVFIARQDISATQVDGLADQYAALIKEHGGEVTKKEYWGLRNLTFRIKKNRKGHYIMFNIDAPPDAVLEMERNMRLSEDVIRYLTVRVKELEADQSIVLRSRGSRDDRGRGGRRFGGPDGGGPRGPREDSRGPREDSRAPRKPEPEAAKAEGAAAEKEGATE
jgi:small subunit ribosomal protein S6